MQETAGTWPRAKEIFADAIAVAPKERAAFVARACGSDRDLRQEVETLLSAHEQAPFFLETRPDIPADLFAAPDRDRSRASIEGRRLGPYEFLSLVGSGGMGDVYKARDLRLNRTVAIKVLPARIAEDRQAGERFEREARAIAALNHPNICTLHDIGREDGIAFLVMEYLDGETLATRLERGPLKAEQSLRFAIQIASALDRVHRAGFVHRDLKPSNIMLTNTGVGSPQAKLLDFGISEARRLNAPPMPGGSADDVRSPVTTLATTGAVLGTIRYIAPEQLDKGPADPRADIFAFGAVLYEMLTGRPAFDGPTTTALIAAVRVQDPPPSSTLTPALDRIIRACLAKDPDDRWQSARDLLRELQWVQEGARERDAGGAHPRRQNAARLLVAAAAIVAVVLAAAAYIAANRRARGERRIATFEVVTPPTGDPMSFALSPDGRQLAFVAMKDGVSKLWVRPLDDLNRQPLDGTDGASFPFWSADSEAIGYFAGGKLQRISARGGRPQVLADAPNGRGGSWTSSNIILFAPTTAGGLMRVSADGGPSEPATHLTPGQNSHRWPQFLPDGKRFVYLSTQGQPGTSGVFIGSLDDGEPTRVLTDDAPAVYVSSRRLVLPRHGELISLAFDPDRRSVSGEPIVVARPVGFDTQLVRGAFSISDTGVLAYRMAIASRRQLVWFDHNGRVLGSVGPPDDHAMAAPELSPDGRRIALFRNVDGNDDVWVIPIDGGIATRFTFAPNLDGFPVWTRDGSGIVYTAFHDAWALVERTMAGEERSLFQTSGLKIADDISPDGHLLLYAVQVPASGVDLWVAPLHSEPDRRARAVVQTPSDEMAGQFAPNGAWIAYQSNASGQMEVYVCRFPGPGAQQQVSSDGGNQPRWSRDGTELYYIAADGTLMTIPIAFDAGFHTFHAAAPRTLFPTHLAAGANIPPAVAARSQYAVAPDGRFLMNVVVDGVAPPIVVSVGDGR